MSWHAEAACRGAYGLMFPGRGENGSIEAAKAVCRACPVRADCLDAAMAGGEKLGVWGGLSERERRKLRAKRAREHGTQRGYDQHRRRNEDACDACKAAHVAYVTRQQQIQRQPSKCGPPRDYGNLQGRWIAARRERRERLIEVLSA